VNQNFAGELEARRALFFGSPLFSSSLDDNNSADDSLLVASVEVRKSSDMLLAASFREHFSRTTTGTSGDGNIDHFNAAMDPKQINARRLRHSTMLTGPSSMPKAMS